MKDEVEFGVLLLAYRRHVSLRKILSVCSRAGIPRIYINVDGPKTANDSEVRDQEAVLSECNSWKEEHPDIRVQIKVNEANVGCSASVLKSIDWAFNFETHLIILEDDCVPDISFFDYCKDAVPFLQIDDKLMLSCGTQFAPLSLTKGKWMKSKYALTWGWSTTREKWLQLKNCMRLDTNIRNLQVQFHEQVYWWAGARRARRGYVDAWDTILVNSMIENGQFAILPSATLVSNVGDDAHATHTHDDSTWLHQDIGSYSPLSTLESNFNVDRWLKTHFYRIGYRHMFTTLLTRLLDIILPNRKRVADLRNRWN